MDINTTDKLYIELTKENAFEGKEDILQVRCMGYFRVQYRKKNGFHVPNGGFRNPLEGRKFKNMGVVAGVSDIIILEARHGYHGLIIELKNKKGKLQDSQKTFLSKCGESGYLCFVCYDFDSFRKIVDWYFIGDKKKKKIKK